MPTIGKVRDNLIRQIDGAYTPGMIDPTLTFLEKNATQSSTPVVSSLASLQWRWSPQKIVRVAALLNRTAQTIADGKDQ